MESFIKSTAQTVEQVFVGSVLQLPWFQRAYAWSEIHVGRLLRDVVEAMTGPNQRYSFGHISLARANGAATASVVDGHQRSVSLTILFALLRDLLNRGAMSDRLHALIEAPRAGGYRLVPQPTVAAFFAENVQQRGTTLTEPEGDISDLSPHEQNILANRDHLRRMLLDHAPTPDKLEALARFLLERCIIVVDEVEDVEEARFLMTREEERGLSPHSSEVAKVTFLTQMPSHEQEEGARLFESAQALLSADDVSNLLGHIRVLAMRRRSSKSAVEELIQKCEIRTTGLPFLTNDLVPHADAMARIIARTVATGEAKRAIGESLRTLSWLDNQMWMPPALHWLKVRGEDHAETAHFLARLDRLAYLMKIANVDPTDQEERYLLVLKGIDAGQAVDAIKPLAIERRLLGAVLENLRSRTFFNKRFHALVLRRISIIMAPGNDPGSVDGKRVTVEHVLPRKPDPTHEWRKDFPNQATVLEYCNRMGNLAFLSREMNNAAANSDFKLKQIVFTTAQPTFVLSTHAAAEVEWSPATIVRRSEALIAILLKPWDLSA